MMDILSSFMVNPSGPSLAATWMGSLGLPTGLNVFGAAAATEVGNNVGSSHFPLTFLTLTPLGNSFLASTAANAIGSDFSFEIFRTGLFHGLFFSLPFSIPMLICFRRYILDGVSLGNYAFVGTLLGHLSFVFCTIQGIRPIIHFWYPLEPLLSLLGLALSLKVATDFFSQRRFVFDGTLGSSEDSSAYALNPWPKMPEISWFLPPEFTRKAPPIVSALLRFPQTIFLALQQAKVLAPLRVLFQKFSNFCEKNLGPSIFTFQFFLMWLNPASASTLNLLFFEHDILQGVFGSRNSPIFLLYTVGFISAATALCTFILFLIYQLAGRNFSFAHLFGKQPNPRSGVPKLASSSSGGAPTGFARGTNQLRWLPFIQFDEALAQNRFKIFNKFFAFLIIGCVVQGGLNYTWRLFLQYPLEMIHWEFFTTLTKNLGIFGRSREATSLAAEIGSMGAMQLREMNAPKEPFQKQDSNPSPGSSPRSGLSSEIGGLGAARPDLMNGDRRQPVAPNQVGSGVNQFGFSLPFSGADEMKSAASSLSPKEPQQTRFTGSSPQSGVPSWGAATKKGVGGENLTKSGSMGGKIDATGASLEMRSRGGLENYWGIIEKSDDFTVPNSLFLAEPRNFVPLGSANDAGAAPEMGSPNPSDQVINFFGRREFPPYDTSIRNREKNLPVERHLAIERVNSRRGLMGRPPLENEERENAIFKYHTFFMNQIDRTVEDLKMKLVTPSDLYREEDDILALQKLHENYLKQKGRESEYQNSVLPPGRTSATFAGKAREVGSSALATGNVPRHHRDFFTKSRPVTNTTKGFSKSSYIRDLFDQNLQEAYSAYSHDDLLLEKIIP